MVLTTLGRVGSPLVRYRTGDLVRENLDIAVREGRHELALRGGILGRADNMVLVRGVNLYPAAVENLMLSLPEVAVYQVEVDARGPLVELHLRVEAAADTSDEGQLAARVQSQFRAAFNLRVPVTVCPPGALPRGEMKSRRWVRRSADSRLPATRRLWCSNLRYGVARQRDFPRQVPLASCLSPQQSPANFAHAARRSVNMVRARPALGLVQKRGLAPSPVAIRPQKWTPARCLSPFLNHAPRSG